MCFRNTKSAARGELGVDRLGPETVPRFGRELLQLEVLEAFKDAGVYVKAASSSPLAVIHWVNGAGSRSTLSA